jgi:hypothetical protein
MRVCASFLAFLLLASCGPEETKLPVSEENLCKLLTNSLAEYTALEEKVASNPSNGLLYNQVAQQQTQAYFRQDLSLRQYFSRNANFNDWILILEEVGGPAFPGHVALLASIPCPTPIKVKAGVVNNGNNVAFLSERRPGDRVLASGRMNYHPVKMAFTILETSYAMHNPVYEADVQSVQTAEKN